MPRSLVLCAAAGALVSLLTLSAARAQDTKATVILPGYRGIVQLDTVGLSRDIDAPQAKVLNAADQALVTLKIPVELLDPKAGYVGNLRLKAQNRFADVAMRQLVECGADAHGPRADFYRIHMALLLTTKAISDTKTTLKVAFAAGAQQLGGLGDPVACQSSGVLEQRLLEMVEKGVR